MDARPIIPAVGWRRRRIKRLGESNAFIGFERDFVASILPPPPRSLPLSCRPRNLKCFERYRQCRVTSCAFIVIQLVKLLRHLCEFCSGFSEFFFATPQNVQKFVFCFSLFSYFIPTRTEGHRVRSMLCLSVRARVCSPFCSQPKAEYENGEEKKTAAECLISRRVAEKTEFAL